MRRERNSFPPPLNLICPLSPSTCPPAWGVIGNTDLFTILLHKHMSQSCCLHLQVITLVNAATLAPCLLTSFGVLMFWIWISSWLIICSHSSQPEMGLTSCLVGRMRDNLIPKEFLEVPLSSTQNSIIQNI